MALELIRVGSGSVIDNGTILYPPFIKPTALHITYTATATVGTRKVQVRHMNLMDATYFEEYQMIPTLTAGQTRYFDLYAGAPASAAFVNTSYATFPLPTSELLDIETGIRVVDNAGIQEGGDTVTLVVTYTAYTLVER